MDSGSLRTASTYLNNLLLSRGLLRNSEPIDFVKPSKESRAQIINLVHDLILREDRSKEEREHVAFTLRQQKVLLSRNDHELDALKAKSDQDARKAVEAQAAERVAREECKKVERGMKSLQDQAIRLKTSLAQVKTQCTNDVRKRDLELARLKAHLQGQQRGTELRGQKKAAVTAPSITITGGARRQPQPAFDASLHSLADPAYSLRQETTEFLTQLSQSLSDENDNLIALIRGALSTLRSLLGLPAHGQELPDSAIGSRGSSDELEGQGNGVVTSALSTSYDKLAADLDTVMTHLKTLLTNPNFVAVQEVEVREEEILRLREGWERMEQRWRDVLMMMEGWRRRMDTGDTINIDDLRRGMGLVSPERERLVEPGNLPEEAEQSFAADEVSEIRLPGSDGSVDEPSVLLEAPRITRSTAAKSSPKRKRDPFEPPDFFDLRPPTATKGESANGRASLPASEPWGPNFDEAHYADDLEPVEFSGLSEGEHMTVEEKLAAAAREAEEAAVAQAEVQAEGHVNGRAKSRVNDNASESASKLRSARGRNVAVTSAELDRTNDTFSGVFSPLKGEPAGERDRRQKVMRSPGLNGTAVTSEQAHPPEAVEQDDTLGKMPSPVKRTRIKGRPRKRKSTLSRDEMDALVLESLSTIED